jgi:hypothetical protein
MIDGMFNTEVRGLCHLLLLKRSVDGLNGRTWDAGMHLDYETSIVEMLQQMGVPNARTEPAPLGDRLNSEAVWDFEAKITPHILRRWDRKRIVAFAKHLLGDECQSCHTPKETP